MLKIHITFYYRTIVQLSSNDINLLFLRPKAKESFLNCCCVKCKPSDSHCLFKFTKLSNVTYGSISTDYVNSLFINVKDNHSVQVLTFQLLLMYSPDHQVPQRVSVSKAHPQER